MHEYLCRQGADGGLMNAVYVDLVVSLIREAGPAFTTDDLMARGGVCHDQNVVARLIQAACDAHAIEPAAGGGWIMVDADRLGSQGFINSAESVRRTLPSPILLPEANVTPPDLLMARDAAKLLGVCEKTLWSMTDQGELPVIRIGRRVSYDPRDLNRWMEANKSTTKKRPTPA